MNINSEEYKILKDIDDEITIVVKNYKLELNKHNIDLSSEKDITPKQERICKDAYDKLYKALLDVKSKMFFKYSNISNFDYIFGRMVQEIINRVVLKKNN